MANLIPLRRRSDGSSAGLGRGTDGHWRLEFGQVHGQLLAHRYLQAQMGSSLVQMVCTPPLHMAVKYNLPAHAPLPLTALGNARNLLVQHIYYAVAFQI